MQRDYKERSRSGRRKTDIPGWAWLLAGTALGLLAALIVYLMRLPSAPTPTAQVQPSAATQPAQSTTPTATPPPKTADAGVAAPRAENSDEARFLFFTELPNAKVEVPAEPIAPPRPTPAPPPATAARQAPPAARPAPPAPQQPARPAPRGEAYVLQLGSYRNAREADSLRAKLAGLGVAASVQRMTIDRKETWYRVRVGPYQNAQQAQQVRDKLRRNGVAAVMLKLRG